MAAYMRAAHNLGCVRAPSNRSAPLILASSSKLTLMKRGAFGAHDEVMQPGPVPIPEQPLLGFWPDSGDTLSRQDMSGAQPLSQLADEAASRPVRALDRRIEKGDEPCQRPDVGAVPVVVQQVVAFVNGAHQRLLLRQALIQEVAIGHLGDADPRHGIPGIDKAIDEGFVEKRSKEALAVNLAGAVLSNTIEQIPDAGRRHRMVQEIRSWASEPDSIARFREGTRRAEIPPDADPSNGSCNGPWFMSPAFTTRTSSTDNPKAGSTARSSARLPGSRRSNASPRGYQRSSTRA